MKIAFVRPNMTDRASGDALEPLVFAILNALTPEDVERTLFDERIESIPFDEPVDLAALTVETFTAKRAYQIASLYRRRGVPVVMGGCHPTLLRQEALRFADSVVVGDAENVWASVVRDARHGRLQRVYEGGTPSLEGLRFDRSVFAGKHYKRLAMIQFGRGCRFNCDFCSVRAFYGKQVRRRPIRELVEEIERLEAKHLFFTDDNLFDGAAETKRLPEALAPLRKKWSCQASLDIAADKELVASMARSGCVSVTIGFESLNNENLKQMGKGWNLNYGHYEDLIRTFHDHGIMIYGTFLFGYDFDTPGSFDKCLDFAIRSQLFLVNFNPLTPTPGTPLYSRLLSENRLIYDSWWLDNEYRYGQSLFHPRGMTADQLSEGCYKARTAFNSFASIGRRGLNFRSNCRTPSRAALFLAANLISRREIHRKQGLALGDGRTSVEICGGDIS